MGEDARPKTVTRVSSGINDMYEVMPVRGEKYVVSGDHVLVLKATNIELRNHFDDIDVKKQRYRIRYLQNFEIHDRSFSISKYGTREHAHEASKECMANEIPKLPGYTKYGDVCEINVREYVDLAERY